MRVYLVVNSTLHGHAQLSDRACRVIPKPECALIASGSSAQGDMHQWAAGLFVAVVLSYLRTSPSSLQAVAWASRQWEGHPLAGSHQASGTYTAQDAQSTPQNQPPLTR